MDDGKTKARTPQQRRVRQQVENILDLCDANWRDELTNPEVNDAVDKIIRAAAADKTSKASELFVVIGFGIAVILIAFGIVGAIAHALGGWFWWIGGGLMLAVIAMIASVISMSFKGAK